jgi:hypothetical protein
MNHPYQDLESLPIWNILSEGLKELEDNRDLAITTDKRYVVGYLLRKMTDKKDVSIDLSRDEAIVLFELLSRFSDNDKLNVEDQSEVTALWSLCGKLESTLVEPLQPDYSQLLTSARNNLKKQNKIR